MSKRISIFWVLCSLVLGAMLLFLPASTAHAQIGGKPGAFSRLGFGARGMGLGNAMLAVTQGDIVAYYNPALLPWAQYRHASATFGLLSLDRSLNFLNFSTALRPNAGLSVGLINAGVSNVDGRDADGKQTGALRTSENEFFLGFGNRFGRSLSLGLTLKLFYHHLYTDMSSTTVGLDVGAAYVVDDRLTLAAAVKDINSKYKWDTSKLYGQQNGAATEDIFPLLYTAGAAYMLPDSLGIVSLEVEMSNAKTTLVRGGMEIPLIPELTVRAGIDRVDLKEKGNGVRPTFGFSVRKEMGTLMPAINYAYVLEPFTTGGIHFVSLSIVF